MDDAVRKLPRHTPYRTIISYERKGKNQQKANRDLDDIRVSSDVKDLQQHIPEDTDIVKQRIVTCLKALVITVG